MLFEDVQENNEAMLDYHLLDHHHHLKKKKISNFLRRHLDDERQSQLGFVRFVH